MEENGQVEEIFETKDEILAEKKDDKEYRCPLCGETLKGRRGLNIHLRRSHFQKDEKRTGVSTMKRLSDRKDWSRKRFDQRNELRIQSTLVRAIYGSAKVKEVEDAYVAGEYGMKDLPINISYYLRLKGVKPGKDQKEEPRKEHEDPPAKDPGRISLARLLSEVRKDPPSGLGKWALTILGLKIDEDSYQYIVDLTVDDSERSLEITSGKHREDMLKESEVVQYLDHMVEEKEVRKGYAVRLRSKVARRIETKAKEGRRWIIMEIEKEDEND